MSPCPHPSPPGPVRDTHQRVVELESTDVVGGDVRGGQGLGDLGHDATLIWEQRGGPRSAPRPAPLPPHTEPFPAHLPFALKAWRQGPLHPGASSDPRAGVALPSAGPSSVRLCGPLRGSQASFSAISRVL